MIVPTKRRFNDFSKLRGAEAIPGSFWDAVVITSADQAQKEVYETQLNGKLKYKDLPTNCQYLVVADPQGYKIGNGGSTMVVLEELEKLFGDQFTDKKVIIFHAGGYSQRLPNASALGKVFVATPITTPVCQMLEMKLASYIDFPGKMKRGGVFVCCSDTLEVYDDLNLPWFFSDTGITGLAHPSSVEIGTTHGVYLLNNGAADHNNDKSLIRECRRFLHKPSAELMRSTEGCIFDLTDNGHKSEFVLTDSAFFMAGDVCKKLLRFYKEVKLLTCEIDAYGDFLQALGSESDNRYICNTANVVSETSSLVEMRTKVFETLRGTKLHVIALSPTVIPSSQPSSVTSHFYHFGTTRECQQILTSDPAFSTIIGSEPLSHCAGVPYRYTTAQSGELNIAGNNPIAGERIGKVESLPCIMVCVINACVSVGQASVIEYCRLRECVSVGHDCIISSCSLPANTIVPSHTFLHTIAVNRPGKSTGFVTVSYGIDDNMKKLSSYNDATEEIKYFGKSLSGIFSNAELAFEGYKGRKSVNLWVAKLFPVCSTMEISARKACEHVHTVLESIKQGVKCTLPNETLMSMSDLLQHKNVKEMLEFRSQLNKDITTAHSQSIL